jgi:ubiquitin-conjugating enzyme E2 M
MLRLQKKPPAASAPAEAGGETVFTGTDATETNGGSLSLLGIGGKQIKTTTAKKATKKRTPGEIRIQKDIAELDGGKVATIDFPNTNDLTSFNVTVSPDSGCWSGAKYLFNFTIPAAYPHEPPKVVCKNKIYHPNINLEGAVCLNILREDWKPVLDINAVIYGLIYLFYEPNPDDPLNREAADLFRNDKTQFARLVKRTLQGYPHGSEQFEKQI